MRALRVLQRHIHPLREPDSPFSQLGASGREGDRPFGTRGGEADWAGCAGLVIIFNGYLEAG